MLLNDEYYMQQALREAEKAFEQDEIPIGAVIIINQKIIARAYNMTEQLNDSTAHAEILALTSAYNFLGSKYLPVATLYVTVEPCLMCTGAMYWSKLARVVWGADDKKNGYKSFLSIPSPLHEEGQWVRFPFHPKTKITTGVLQEECAALMKTFFQQKR
ncbi:MAG TPA: nucleoside deaminase [Parafilimonas sp.]|nr:nucleoside deaminase [Parafilimonas sp.]